MADQEQDVKRRRVEGEEAAPAAEEKPVEQEKDESGKMATFKEQIGFNLCDCTLNVVPTLGGRVLTALTDGGLQYLMAGARASHGAKGGRYLFEAKIVEMMASTEAAAGPPRNAPMPRQVLRVGVAAEGQQVFLGETEEAVSFDSEGMTISGRQREVNGKRFGRGHTVGVLVNLDQQSPNKNTVSLFLDGERATQPVALPESMHGKALFPVVNFRNVTVQANFGSAPMKPLPFTCRTFQQLDAKDAVKGPTGGPGKDGKYEVLFPVGVPDEGTFDWLDDFLKKNPQYCEISDRAMIQWAEWSGIMKPQVNQWKTCNDKPDVHFGIPMLDDASARRVLNSVVATQPRNYVVMEVQGNLLPEERAESLKRFPFPNYKKVAQVTMGEPPADLKKLVHDELLKQKQESEELAWKARKVERERKKAMEEQQKKMEEAQELSRRKEEALQAAEDVKIEDAAKGEDVKDEDVKTEVKEEEKAVVKEEPTEEDEPMPVATLTEEEKKQCFRKKAVTDLSYWSLCASLGKFKLPEQGEGFDDVRFTWSSNEQAKEYFKAWLMKQKLMCRIDDLTPGDWFRQRLVEWQKTFLEWQRRHQEFNDPTQQAMRRARAEEAARLKAEEEARAKAEAEAKAAAEAPAKEGEAAAEGGEGEKKEPAEEKKEEAPKAEEAPAAEKPAEEAKKEEEKKEVDVNTVEDVMDIGDGEPLFAQFTWEDWALLTLRLELVLLVQAFKKDVDDPERAGIHESHLGFYYGKYFSKAFNIRYYGTDTAAELINLVKDSVELLDNGALATSLPTDFNFDLMVKRTEEERRGRMHRLKAGDESARLNFNQPPQAPPRGGPPRPGGYAPVLGSALPPPPAPGAPPAYGGGKGGPGGPYGGGGKSFGKGVCRSFQMHGNCRYGATCRYAHS